MKSDNNSLPIPRVPRTRKKISHRKPKANDKDKKPTVRGREVSISSTDMAMELIYGRMMVGGAIVWVATGPERGDLFLVVALAGHQIHAIEKTYVDNREVYFGNAGPDFGWNTGIEEAPKIGYATPESADLFRQSYAYGTSNQDAIADLVSATASWQRDRWTADHRLLGCAHTAIRLKFNDTKWPDGLPDLSFLIQGKAVYDPRNNTTAWSLNAALIIADYLKDSIFGLNVAHDDIYWGTSANDVGSVWWAAEVCVQQVEVPLGTVDRYQINGVIDSRMTPETVLEEMADAIAGDIVFVDNQWRIYPGVWTESVLALSDADLVGNIIVETDTSKNDKINSVKGQFINPWSLYDGGEFPPYTNWFYTNQDGEPLYDDLTLNLVQQVNQAQRIAKILIERARQSITVHAIFNLSAYKVNVCDNITLTIPRYGWHNKPFRVEDITLNVDAQTGLTVTLVLHETAAGIYNWANGDQTTIDLAPNSDLPNPFYVPPPVITAVESGTEHLYIRQDGTVQSRMWVQWQLADDVSLTAGGSLTIYYKKQGDSEWQNTPDLSGGNTYVYISDVEDGKIYEIQAQAYNSLGVASIRTASITHQVIGKTAPPSDVTNFRGKFASFGFTLQWNNIPDLDLKHYEIREFNSLNPWNGGDAVDWEESNLLVEVRSTSYPIQLLPTGSHKYCIKAVDTSGNKSVNAAWFDFAVLAPVAPQLSGAFVGPEYVLTWTTPSGEFTVEEYEVRTGDTLETSTVIVTTKANRHQAKAIWNGVRRFFVRAIDVARNIGTAAVLDLEVQAPSVARGISAQVVDNNVWLRWQEPEIHSLPIEFYRVTKGDVFADSALLADSGGTFFPFFEFVKGTYTYWVQAFDSAGNMGVVGSVSALVNAPPDFYLDVDEILGKPEELISVDNNPVTRIDETFFGTQFASTTNANTPLYGNGLWYITFQSPYSGKMKGFRAWYKTDSKVSPSTQQRTTAGPLSSVYSGITTGGTPNYVINNYDVQLCADNAGAPGAVLATITNAFPNMINNNSADNMRTLNWPSAVTLVKDAIYHIKYINRHANPTQAFFSFNGHGWLGAASADAGMKAMQPTWYAKGQTKRLRIWSSANGNSYMTNTPTVLIGYDLDNDGTADKWFGVTHYGGNHARFSSPSTYTADGTLFGGATMLRQSLTPQDTMTVSKITVSAQRLSGSGNLIATLKNSGGTVIETVTITASQFLLPANYNLGGNPKPQWGTGDFSTPRTLTGGQKYYIEFSCAAGTQYHINSSTDLANIYGWPSGQQVDGLWGGAGGTSELLQISTNSGSSWSGYSAAGSSHQDACYYLTAQVTTSVSTNDPVLSSVAWMSENKFIPCTQNKSWEDWFETGLSGGGGWSLLAEPTLSMYLDAIVDANIATAGGNVSAWTSEGNSGNVLAAASNYPVHNSGGDYITFNNALAQLTDSSLGDTTLVEGLNDACLYAVFTFDKVNNAYICGYDDGTSQPGFSIRYFGGSWYAYCNNTSSAGNISASASGYNANDKILVGIIKDGTDLKISVNGTVTAGGTATGFTASRFMINKTGNSSVQRVHAIASAASADQAVTDKIEGTLAHQYGIQSALRADHPYKAAAPTESTTITNSFQDQIDAGATYYIEPMALNGVVTFLHDMGAVLSTATTVGLEWIFKQLKGVTDIDCTISTSPDNVTYTNYTKNALQVSASNFRYIKVRFDCTNSDEFSVATIENVHLTVMAKITTWQMQGVIEAGEANATGKWVYFPPSEQFVSVVGATPTPIGNVAKFGTWDVPAGDHPPYIKIWMFDAAGNFVSGNFSLIVRGIR